MTHQKSCAAQVWGVAEILRVIKDYGLEKSEDKKPPAPANQIFTNAVAWETDLPKNHAI
jgi:glycogen debranching enzyme